MLATIVGAWHIPSVCSMEQKPTRTRPKKTHRQRHGTLDVHTCIVEPHDGAGASALWLTRLDHSLSSSEPGRCPHRTGSETREIHQVDRAGTGRIQTVTWFFYAKTQLFSRRFSFTALVLLRLRTVQNNTTDHEFSWGRGHVHPCYCPAPQQASKPCPSFPWRYIHPCCRQHVQNVQKPQLLISKETKMHSFAQVHHRARHSVLRFR